MKFDALKCSRRSWLACGSGAFFGAALVGLARKVASDETSFRGKIRKALKFQMIDDPLSTEDKLRMLRDLGFDGVEVSTTQHGTSKQTYKELLSASDKLGFPVHGVVNSSKPDLMAAIDEAKTYSATSVLHVVPYDKSISYLENYRNTQDNLRRVADYAAKQEIMVLLENVWATFLIEPLGMARYLDEIGSPWIASYFDIGNVMRWGWPEHWIEVLGKRVKKLDVKEYDLDLAMGKGMRAGFQVPIGEGSIDWSKVRSELVKIGYEGWATAEVPGGDRKRLGDISEQMNRALAL